MFLNYLKIAFRNFKKHRMTFGINLLGLTLGLTTVILIMMWVKDELSVNRTMTLGIGFMPFQRSFGNCQFSGFQSCDQQPCQFPGF